MAVKAFYNVISDFKVIIQEKTMASIFLTILKILIASRNVSEHVFCGVLLFLLKRNISCSLTQNNVNNTVSKKDSSSLIWRFNLKRQWVTENWHRFPQEVVESPSLKLLQSWTWCCAAFSRWPCLGKWMTTWLPEALPTSGIQWFSGKSITWSPLFQIT